MAQKRKRSKNKSTTPLILIPVVLAIVAAAIWLVHSNGGDTKASSSIQPAAADQPSKFTFNSAAAPGWQKGPTNHTSLALFSSDHTCFASMEYKAGTVDVDAELDKLQADFAENRHVSTTQSTVQASLKSSKGSLQYELQQYSVGVAGNAGKLYGSQEFGYISLDGGHIFVQGNCNTVDQLPATIDALQAISFDESK